MTDEQFKELERLRHENAELKKLVADFGRVWAYYCKLDKDNGGYGWYEYMQNYFFPTKQAERLANLFEKAHKIIIGEVTL